MQIRYELWPQLLCLIESLQESGSYCGATHIQKAAFLVQEVTGLDLGLEFKLYHHGPFSFDLRELLDELEAADAVKCVPNPPYGPKYALTENAYGFWAQFETNDFDPIPIEFIARKLAKKNVSQLEAYGTAALVFREMPDAGLGQLKQKLQYYKQHIDDARATEALNLIMSWKQEWQTEKIATA